nr:hypothetical protein CFP56_12629 [Quercus suber]
MNKLGIRAVCRVCDILLKSESHWDAHQVSRKHHEAINTIKANAAGLTWVNNVKAEPHKELIKPKSVQSTESHSVKAECSTELPKNQSSMLPPNFFDNNDTKMLKTGKDSLKSVETDLYKKTGLSVLPEESSNMRWEVDDRFEKEEIDAAEMIEEAEAVEQKTYWEKVEMLRKKKLELQVARPVKRRKASEGVAKESRHEESSSDNDSGENFAVDWRAQHLNLKVASQGSLKAKMDAMEPTR